MIQYDLIICISQVQGINCLVFRLLVFKLLDVAAHEIALLDECDSLWASAVAMKVTKKLYHDVKFFLIFPFIFSCTFKYHRDRVSFNSDDLTSALH